ncbi:hypothetical protein BS47DRAFT_1369566 [Hydnum rufescens UP504]|uniref:Uncharacterized protein n=1 Tax=Hydnum rufescens UP504 TaxID=1448309 RepID=A0A9P6ACF3_9AGAM|nr:hypothetical protein BS47DRAFT_1369566 [Hydnum rufescens UP504]
MHMTSYLNEIQAALGRLWESRLLSRHSTIQEPEELCYSMISEELSDNELGSDHILEKLTSMIPELYLIKVQGQADSGDDREAHYHTNKLTDAQSHVQSKELNDPSLQDWSGTIASTDNRPKYTGNGQPMERVKADLGDHQGLDSIDGQPIIEATGDIESHTQSKRTQVMVRIIEENVGLQPYIGGPTELLGSSSRKRAYWIPV